MATKRAVILTADQFEDMEVFVPLFRLLEEGVEVDVVAPHQPRHLPLAHGSARLRAGMVKMIRK